MTKDSKVHLFVAGTALAALLSGSLVWRFQLPFPGWWPLATFILVASLLESLNTQLRLAAKGSTSFIMHMAAALLFGGWWGALVAAVGTLVGEIVRNNAPIKLTFNVAQRILAVALAALVYQGLG